MLALFGRRCACWVLRLAGKSAETRCFGGGRKIAPETAVEESAV